jgi:hypothetical protein
MARAYSQDLRDRVIDAGTSARSAAVAETALRWMLDREVPIRAESDIITA